MTTREVETLERIAKALERIADSLDGLKRCVFNASADPGNPDKERPALRVFDWSRD